jgi:hypothetical protein
MDQSNVNGVNIFSGAKKRGDGIFNYDITIRVKKEPYAPYFDQNFHTITNKERGRQAKPAGPGGLCCGFPISW